MKKESRRLSSFPLRLPPTMKRQAHELADHEGLSLNHFISLAIAEKIIRMESQTWANESSANELRLRESRIESTTRQ